MAKAKSTTSRKTSTPAAAATTAPAPSLSNMMSNMSMGSNTSPYSLASFVNWVSNNFVLVFIVGVFFIGGFFAGSLWTENQMLKNGTAGTGSQPTVAAGAAAPAAGAAADAGAPAGPTEDQLKQAPPITDADHIRGNKNAQVMLLEYSDFECPFCARFHPTIQQVAKDYGDKVAWVYRSYPLPFHPHAQKAAEGAECVTKLVNKDAFWKYADAIFTENTNLGGQLTPEAITKSAEAAGVNKDAFQKCLDSGEMAQKVKDQMEGGSKAGVNGTPGTIVISKDGKYEMISGALPIDQVKATLDKYVK